MRHIIDFFSSIGTTEKHSPSEKRIIHIVNQASVIAILFTIIFLFSNLYYSTYDTVIPSLLSIILFALVPFFNYRKEYKKAKLFFVSISLITTTLTVAATELHTHMYYYFVIIFAVMLVFFPKKGYLKLIFAVNLICISCSMTISYLDLLPKLSLPNPEILGVINMLILFLVIYMSVSTLMKENYVFEQKTIKLLGNINERNVELKAEKEKVEIASDILTKTNADLHQEVIEREKVEKSLRESNYTLQQFTYVASHDMKEPLRTIGSFSGLLARRLSGKLDEREQEYLDFITDGVSRMSFLLDDLLKYATLNNPISFERLDLNNTVQVIKHSLMNLLERKNGEIEVGKMPVLYANRSQLNQLLQNLISNGLKFNNKQNPKIKITCQEQEDSYLFCVSDNGIGIPKEHQEKIWMLFQRLHSREQFEGSGIGLTVAQKVVTNHQGSIWVESETDKGTSFYFTISKKLSLPSVEMLELRDNFIVEATHN